MIELFVQNYMESTFGENFLRRKKKIFLETERNFEISFNAALSESNFFRRGKNMLSIDTRQYFFPSRSYVTI